ncbi:MAG TPA: CidA/LrgA family protein [Kiloniellales bacterium]|nr:CidA/LrgA family protein [Kiloniellales bacterium]
MLAAMTLLLACQLAGESLTRLLQLPVPGPVFGMIFLLVLLVLRRSTLALVEPTADTLLANLILMYVPACVGLMAHLETLEAEWLPIAVAVAASTLLTLVVTALVFRWVSGRAVRGKLPA